MKLEKSTQHTLNLLLSGKHPKTKKYAGKHVMIIEESIVPLREGVESLEEIEKLEKKYGKTPVLAFIPRPDISYILILCL